MNVDIFIIGKICAKLDKFPKCRHFDNYLEFSEAIFQIVDILIGSPYPGVLIQGLNGLDKLVVSSVSITRTKSAFDFGM